jgi:hypothetical protein
MFGGLFLLVIGIALVAYGFRGRRVGTEPRCERCGYDLTGLQSEHCPECGVSAILANTVVGVHRKRPLPIAVGALVLGSLFFGATAIEWAGETWRRVTPFSWLLSDARGGSAAALSELSRRFRAEELSVGQVGALMDAGVSVQSAPKPTDYGSLGHLASWLELLHLAYKNGVMNADQSAQFLSQLVAMSLTARSRVRAGQPLPCSVQGEIVGPRDLLVYSYGTEVQFFVGDRSVCNENRHVTWFGAGVRTGPPHVGHPFECDTTGLPPGDYTLTLKFHQKVRFRPTYVPEQATGDFDGKVTLTAPFTIVADDPVRKMPYDRSDFAEVNAPVDIRDCIAIDRFTYFPPSGKRPAQVTVEPSFCGDGTIFNDGESQNGTRPCSPIDLAFELFIVPSDGLERAAGSMVYDADKRQLSLDTGQKAVAPFDDETVTVILRCSTRAARSSRDVYEIWDGDVTLENVSVERDELTLND